MARLRYNGLSGTLGAAHDGSTTTLTLASKLVHEGGDVPTISGDYIPLSILDSNGNCAEVVHVTAYTSAATTATVTRGAEGTAASAHDNGATFVNGPTAYDYGLSPVGINEQTGTTYTYVLSDAGKIVEHNNGSAITATVPPNSSVAFPVGTRIALLQTGAGQVTVAAGSGVTINTAETLKLEGQWAAAELLKRGTDTWVLYGRLEAAA